MMEVNVRQPLVYSSYPGRCVSLRSLADLEGADPAPKRGLRRVTSDSVARAARKWRGSMRDDGREGELDPARKHIQFGWPLQRDAPQVLPEESDTLSECGENVRWHCGSILLRPKGTKSSEYLHQGTYIYHVGTRSHQSAVLELVSFSGKKVRVLGLASFKRLRLSPGQGFLVPESYSYRLSNHSENVTAVVYIATRAGAVTYL